MKTVYCFVVVMTAVLSACRKDNIRHFIGGTIYQDCSMKPLAGAEVWLSWWRESSCHNDDYQLYKTITSSQGKFLIDHIAGTGGELTLWVNPGPIKLEYLPEDRHLKLDLISHDTGTLIVTVRNLMSDTVDRVEDTVYYSLECKWRWVGGDVIKLPDSITTDTFLLPMWDVKWDFENWNRPTECELIWGLGKADYQLASHNDYYNRAPCIIIGCGVMDEVTIILD